MLFRSDLLPLRLRLPGARPKRKNPSRRVDASCSRRHPPALQRACQRRRELAARYCNKPSQRVGPATLIITAQTTAATATAARPIPIAHETAIAAFGIGRICRRRVTCCARSMCALVTLSLLVRRRRRTSACFYQVALTDAASCSIMIRLVAR